MSAHDPGAADRPTPCPTPSIDLLAQVSDALVWPLLVLQTDGRLLHANRAARRVLQDGQPLRLRPDQDLQLADETLQSAFDAAWRCASTSGQRGLLHWPATDTSEAYAATLTPLDSVAADGTSPVLMALATADSRQNEADAFACLHGLSHAEARALRLLACGCSSVDIARALGVTPSTVRSQLLYVRRKTGYANVASLLHALVRMPPVLPLQTVLTVLPVLTLVPVQALGADGEFVTKPE